jgi:DNA-directed RNA polymerase specialized sigma24 family protein
VWNSEPTALVMNILAATRGAVVTSVLPEECQSVAASSFAEEFSCRKIADMADCPVGMVGSRLYGGQRILQRVH